MQLYQLTRKHRVTINTPMRCRVNCKRHYSVEGYFFTVKRSTLLVTDTNLAKLAGLLKHVNGFYILFLLKTFSGFMLCAITRVHSMLEFIVGGYFVCAANLMGLISVKQFYLLPIILVLEKYGISP